MKGMSITEINLKIQEIFGSESPEIKAEIQKICDEDNQKKGCNESNEGTILDNGKLVSNTNEVESDPSVLCR